MEGKKTAPNQSRTNFLLVNFTQAAEGGAGSGSSGGARMGHISKCVACFVVNMEN